MVDLYGFDYFFVRTPGFLLQIAANLEQISKRVNDLKICIFVGLIRLFIDIQCFRYVFMRMRNLLIKNKNIKIQTLFNLLV